MTNQTRRNFIKTGATAMGAGIVLPAFARQANGVTVVESLRHELVAEDRILVVVELAGGNDPLNTIVPLAQYDTYASFRSRLAIPRNQVLALNGSTTMGLSPHLSAIKPIADAGKLAVIQGVHYPNPNLSHDGSRNIYRIGDPQPSVTAQTGWLGRHSLLFGSKTNPLDTVGIGGVNTTLYAPSVKISGIGADAQGNPSGYAFNTDGRYGGDRNNRLAIARWTNPDASPSPYADFAENVWLDALNSSDAVSQSVAAYSSSVTYPTTNFAGGLKLIAKMASSSSPKLGTRVFYITQGGYDTHANQDKDLPTLHKALGEGLKAFYDDLTAKGLADKTLILIWSEFGRRVADNASIGTDHGQANNFYFIGGKVKGGMYGSDPNLTDLQQGNLKHQIDFRDVYSTVIQGWLGNSAAEAAQVLGGTFNNLAVFV
ncbi:MAG: DUF1501 domain-containing protein [Acidobacteria bacterium]|nr:DUF1501 domain-containing protein [Acidobacteriota bacterium]